MIEALVPRRAPPAAFDALNRRDLPRATVLLFVIVAAVLTGCWNRQVTGRVDPSDNFETVRTYVQGWLSEAASDEPLISASTLKDTILDDWSHQGGKYAIVSVRKPDDDRSAGQIPHAVNVPWVDIVSDESLARLPSDKTLLVYCYYGHSSMLCCTILNLLGYKSRSLSFGMMGWNLDALVKPPWDQQADHEVELTPNTPEGPYPPPAMIGRNRDARSVIKQLARGYLSGEGSPVITSADVRTILDAWDQKKAEYQIIDVRSKMKYAAGHVPHSINIPWAEIAAIDHLKQLDPKRIAIVYSENGQTGQLATTVLSMFGYHAVDMKFGMMDWNQRYVDRSERWNGAAGYPVEVTQQGPGTR